MNLWVYKVRNNPDTPYNAYGDWNEVFKRPWRSHPWGGAWATGKPDGKKIFDDEISKGDLVLAWQSDRNAAIGLCKVVGWGQSVQQGADLILQAVEQFPVPVKLHDLKKTTHPELNGVSALKQGNAGTIYRTSPQEAQLLLKACGSTRSV